MLDTKIMFFYKVCKNLNSATKKYHVKKLIYKTNPTNQTKKLIRSEIIKYSKKQMLVFYRTINPINYSIIDAEYI